MPVLDWTLELAIKLLYLVVALLGLMIATRPLRRASRLAFGKAKEKVTSIFRKED